MFTRDCILLPLLRRAHVDWNWPGTGGKQYRKNRLVCKNAVALAYYGSCRQLVMGSWHSRIVLIVSSKAVDFLYQTATNLACLKDTDSLSYEFQWSVYLVRMIEVVRIAKLVSVAVMYDRNMSILTTFWRHLWSTTEQTQGNMKNLYFSKRLSKRR